MLVGKCGSGVRRTQRIGLCGHILGQVGPDRLGLVLLCRSVRRPGECCSRGLRSKPWQRFPMRGMVHWSLSWWQLRVRIKEIEARKELPDDCIIGMDMHQLADPLGFRSHHVQGTVAPLTSHKMRVHLPCHDRLEFTIQVLAQGEIAAFHIAISLKMVPNSRRAMATDRPAVAGEHSSTRATSRYSSPAKSLSRRLALRSNGMVMRARLTVFTFDTSWVSMSTYRGLVLRRKSLEIPFGRGG